MKIDVNLRAADLGPAIERVFTIASGKIQQLDRSWDRTRGTPVFTVNGQYTTRGWTEWTQGFQYGCALLAFDATGDQALLDLGRRRTLEFMAPHLTHTGVHDHGFNNVSTYGNLRRLMRQNKIPHNDWELAFYELSLKCSGAVQAARWTDAADGAGYIYSFNGPHSLFIDTMRTLRVLAVAHQLGHTLLVESDRRVSLLNRLITHALTSAKYNIFYGQNRDAYDTPATRGRTAHEAIFNINDGRYRCPNSQQGYSPFTTWTRGLAWAMLGFAEQLEFLSTVSQEAFTTAVTPAKAEVLRMLEEAARATCDFYITQAAAADGICYWDTGAPNLEKLGDWRTRPADPFNDHEPVDSSAGVVAAQGLLRLGRFLNDDNYTQAGLSLAAATLFSDTYLSSSASHQGLLLHSIYHRPNGWDHVRPGRKSPGGESSMWGDYHLLELALYLQRQACGQYLCFFA